MPLEYSPMAVFPINKIHSLLIVLQCIVPPRRFCSQQSTLSHVTFLSSLAVHQEMSKCKTYRLPRCQPQAIIPQSKQKERLSIFIHPAFTLLLKL